MQRVKTIILLLNDLAKIYDTVKDEITEVMKKLNTSHITTSK